MPFHWCMDESILLLGMLPFIGILFKKLHAWWHKRFQHKCHHDHCHDIHIEHISRFDQKMETLIDEWDQVDQTLVEERFGAPLIDGLKQALFLYGLNQFLETESTWFVNSNGGVKVKVRNNEFIHDHRCDPTGWDELISGGRLSK